MGPESKNKNGEQQMSKSEITAEDYFKSNFDGLDAIYWKDKVADEFGTYPWIEVIDVGTTKNPDGTIRIFFERGSLNVAPETILYADGYVPRGTLPPKYNNGHEVYIPSLYRFGYVIESDFKLNIKKFVYHVNAGGKRFDNIPEANLIPAEEARRRGLLVIRDDNNEPPKPNAEETAQAAVSVLKQILSDLPSNRDWLDPAVELAARNIIKQTEPGPRETDYDEKGGWSSHALAQKLLELPNSRVYVIADSIPAQVPAIRLTHSVEDDSLHIVTLKAF